MQLPPSTFGFQDNIFKEKRFLFITAGAGFGEVPTADVPPEAEKGKSKPVEIATIDEHGEITQQAEHIHDTFLKKADALSKAQKQELDQKFKGMTSTVQKMLDGKFADAFKKDSKLDKVDFYQKEAMKLNERLAPLKIIVVPEGDKVKVQKLREVPGEVPWDDNKNTYENLRAQMKHCIDVLQHPDADVGDKIGAALGMLMVIGEGMGAMKDGTLFKKRPKEVVAGAGKDAKAGLDKKPEGGETATEQGADPIRRERLRREAKTQEGSDKTIKRLRQKKEAEAKTGKEKLENIEKDIRKRKEAIDEATRDAQAFGRSNETTAIEKQRQFEKQAKQMAKDLADAEKALDEQRKIVNEVERDAKEIDMVVEETKKMREMMEGAVAAMNQVPLDGQPPEMKDFVAFFKGLSVSSDGLDLQLNTSAKWNKQLVDATSKILGRTITYDQLGLSSIDAVQVDPQKFAGILREVQAKLAQKLPGKLTQGPAAKPPETSLPPKGPEKRENILNSIPEGVELAGVQMQRYPFNLDGTSHTIAFGKGGLSLDSKPGFLYLVPFQDSVKIDGVNRTANTLNFQIDSADVKNRVSLGEDQLKTMLTSLARGEEYKQLATDGKSTIRFAMEYRPKTTTASVPSESKPAVQEQGKTEKPSAKPESLLNAMPEGVNLVAGSPITFKLDGKDHTVQFDKQGMILDGVRRKFVAIKASPLGGDVDLNLLDVSRNGSAVTFRAGAYGREGLVGGDEAKVRAILSNILASGSHEQMTKDGKRIRIG